jgi:hypothetical protein
VARRLDLLRFQLLLFAVIVSVYALGGPTFFGYDGEIMFRVTESLGLRHSFQITDPLAHANEPYSWYGLGVSLLLLPLFGLGRLLLHNGASLISLYEPSVTALTAVALHGLLRELGGTWRCSLILALSFAFGTMAWHYAGFLFSEPLVGLALTAALWALLRFRAGGRSPALAAAGVALAVALLARWDSLVLVVLPVTIYAIYQVWVRRGHLKKRGYRLAAFGIPIAGALVVNLLYNAHRYGSPLSFGYTPQFRTPLLKGLYGLLLSPGAGLFVYVPLAALALVGFPNLWRLRRAEAILIVALVAPRLLLYAQWADWQGGATWGPRFLLPVVPLLLIPIAFLPQRQGMRWFAALFLLISVAVQVVDQVVPYGLVYSQAVPIVAATLNLLPCTTCSVIPPAELDAILEVMNFNWRFAPLVWQLQFLGRGLIDPPWRSLVVVMPVIALAVGAAILLLGRLAHRLDATQTPGP